MSEIDENSPLNILVFGSGAREHAIVDAISKSHIPNKLFLAQTGAFSFGETIEFTDFEDLGAKCSNIGVDLAIIGSEEPLCMGIVDILKNYNIPCIGVNKYFSQLEGSKLFGKVFMGNYGIKTAKYEVLDSREKENVLENSYLSFLDLNPLVIKADGLCKGKGVFIAKSRDVAEKAISDYIQGKFGEHSKVILLEEFLKGEELSLISLWDGKNLLHFSPTRDFKKLNNLPDAPNTGGMGAFCPVALTLEKQTKLDNYKQQLQNALTQERADFVGFIYSGLIWSRKDWYVLEYNVRMGDPECQAILTHLETDFLEILLSAKNQQLDKVELKFKDNYSACLVIACEGYPEKPLDGEKIVIPEQKDIRIYNAGVKKIDGQLYSKGGRVLSLCINSDKPFPILKKFAEKIEMKNKYFRQDIDIN